MPSGYDDNSHGYRSPEPAGFGALFWAILFVAVLILLW
jgi:hypothetical protein